MFITGPVESWFVCGVKMRILQVYQRRNLFHQVYLIRNFYFILEFLYYIKLFKSIILLLVLLIDRICSADISDAIGIFIRVRSSCEEVQCAH